MMKRGEAVDASRMMMSISMIFVLYFALQGELGCCLICLFDLNLGILIEICQKLEEEGVSNIRNV